MLARVEEQALRGANTSRMAAREDADKKPERVLICVEVRFLNQIQSRRRHLVRVDIHARKQTFHAIRQWQPTGDFCVRTHTTGEIIGGEMTRCCDASFEGRDPTP